MDKLSKSSSSTNKEKSLDKSLVDKSLVDKPLVDKSLKEYMKTFTEKEKKAYDIASSHLGSSFSLEKSLGFLQWLKLQSP
jgi:hypothetical protein